MNEKVYTPEVIEENPFPGGIEPVILSGQQNPAGVYTPSTSKSKTFPKKRTAVELLSTALNTRSKKILQEFELQQSGGLKIGDFKEGLSGDVKVTPNGIVGRNSAGLTTFALDNDGNLILVGELRSGSVITGQIIMGSDGEIVIGDEDGATIIDAIGLSSQNNFSSVEDIFSGDYSFSSTTMTALPDIDVSIVLKRPTKVLFLVTVELANEQTVGGLDMSGQVQLYVKINTGTTEVLNPPILVDTSLVNATGIKENVIRKTYNTAVFDLLSKGNFGITDDYPVSYDLQVVIDHVSPVNLTTHVYYCSLIAIALGS